MAKRYSKEARTYNKENLEDAVSAVKQRKVSIAAAACDYSVPRKTLDDHVKGRVGYKTGPPTALTVEEERSLVNYIEYLGSRGFPVSRDIIRQYVIAIIRQSGRKTTFNMEKGPSHKWFRKFYKKHPTLKEGQAEMQDRGRSRMANQRVMNQYFTLLEQTLDRLKVKPSQIFNCDETGWSGKEKSRQKVGGKRGHHSYQQTCLTTGHITAHLCICADGRILPTFLIFEGSLPHTAYRDGIPESWMFGHPVNGYMDHELFQSWFEKIFIPNCGSTRPVLLTMDNHDSHITLDVINIAIKNQIELLCLPPHTTHILQPLDVHINGPLKARTASVATLLGHLNKHQQINKAKFPIVLSYTVDQFCSPARIKDAFRMTGMSPLDADAIDKTQLVESHSVTTDKSESPSVTSGEEPVPSSSTSHENDVSPALNKNADNKESAKSICVTCGTFLGGNPLVTEGLIPQRLADIFQPVPCKPLVVTSRKMVTESRVITSAEFVKKLTDKMEEDQKKKDELERRKREREEKRLKREEEKAKRIEKKQKTKNAQKKDKTLKRKSEKKAVQNQTQNTTEKYYKCKICNQTDPDISDESETQWISCDKCEDWVHLACVGFEENNNFDKVDFLCPNCSSEE